MYVVTGTYNGRTEDVDYAETWQEAEYLRGEYQLAFGREWRVRVKYRAHDRHHDG